MNSKKVYLSENDFNLAFDRKAQNCFLNTIQQASLDSIKSWSVTCPSTLESLQETEFEINNDMNSSLSLSKRHY